MENIPIVTGQISHGMAKIRITGRGYSSTHSVEGRNAKRKADRCSRKFFACDEYITH